MQVVDLVESPMPMLWNDVLNEIKNSKDKLKENYISIDFKDFISFPCVIKNNKIICFSGLQYDESKWGKNIARCSSRLWIHPDYRISSLNNFSGGKSFINTTYCLPIQIEKARLNNISVLFISRKDNLKGFQKYIDLIKINCGVEFTISRDLYNVCGKILNISDSCKQYVAIHYLDKKGRETWISNMLDHIIIES